MSNLDDYKYIIEIRSIYDGWSIGVTYDNEYVNRWDKDDYRYLATEEVIENLKSNGGS